MVRRRRQKPNSGWVARRLRGVAGNRGELDLVLALDTQLLEDIDGHERTVNEYVGKFISDCMDRVGRGFTMTASQRAFAQRTLTALDGGD